MRKNVKSLLIVVGAILVLFGLPMLIAGIFIIFRQKTPSSIV